MKNSWFIIIDGLDKIGKTTQIGLLKQHFIKQKKKIFTTRCIGGPADPNTIPYMQKIRDIVFNDQLPPETEEMFLDFASTLNLRMIYKLQKKKQYDFLIQDRGPLSHVSYGLAKKHNRITIDTLYSRTLDYFQYYINNYINICLMPDKFSWLENRLKTNNVHEDSSKRHDELEKIAFQKKVYKNMLKEFEIASTKYTSDFIDINTSHLVKISEKQTPLEVHQEILKIINERISQ